MPATRARRKRATALALAGAVALAGSGCADDAPPAKARAGTIAVTLDDFLIAPQRVRASAGRITFRVVNRGRVGHTLHVFRGERDALRHQDTAPGQAGDGLGHVLPRRLQAGVRARQPRGAGHVRHPDRQMKLVEPDHFRSVMGNFATGVAVVTATGPSARWA